MGKLTTAARKRLPKSDFALGKAPGTKGRFPINDANHARNALSRVAQTGTPAEKAKVRAAVHKKFPGIGQKGKPKKAKSEAVDPHNMTHEQFLKL